MTLHAPTLTAARTPVAALPTPAIHPLASVLPEPADTVTSDGLSEVYRFICQAENRNAANDQTSVTVESTQRKNDLAQEKKDLDAEQKAQEGGHGFFGAIEKAIGDIAKDVVTLNAKDLGSDIKTDIGEDMWNNPHFWSDLASVAKDVGEVAAIVAGTALTVGTGGAGGVVLAVAIGLSVSAMADQQLHILNALGVSDKISGYIDGGMAIASAAMTGGVAIASAGAATAAATTSGQLVKNLGVATTIVQGTTTAVGGAATIRQGQLDAEAQEDAANETQDQQNIDRVDRLTAWFVDALKESKEGFDKAKSTVQGAIQTRDATSVALSSFSKA